MSDDICIIFSIKFKSSTIVGSFSVTEFLDFLEVRIEKLYREKLNSRILDDEFDTEHPYDFCDPKDTTFYSRCFLPHALILTYKEVHSNSDDKDIWDDVFTVGAGSRTQDLIPETQPICQLCGSVFFKALKDLDQEQIKLLNYQVFKAQKQNFFLRPKLAKLLLKSDCADSNSNDDSDNLVASLDISKVMEVDPFNPFSEDSFEEIPTDNSEKKVQFNPFSSDDDELDTDVVVDEPKVYNYCPKCSKGFSLLVYLDYHNQVFHSSRSKSVKSIIPRFVPEGEDLMTSFSRPDELNHSMINKKANVKVSLANKKSLRKSRRNLDL